MRCTWPNQHRSLFQTVVSNISCPVLFNTCLFLLCSSKWCSIFFSDKRGEKLPGVISLFLWETMLLHCIVQQPISLIPHVWFVIELVCWLSAILVHIFTWLYVTFVVSQWLVGRHSWWVWRWGRTRRCRQSSTWWDWHRDLWQGRSTVHHIIIIIIIMFA